MSNRMKGAKSIVLFKDLNKAERKYIHLIRKAIKNNPFNKCIGSKPLRQLIRLAIFD